MVCHRAGGSGATDPGAGIFTFVGQTGQVAGTLLVDGALWLALSVGISLQARQAGTGCRQVPLSADSIEAAGTWSAGINDLRLGRPGYKVKRNIFQVWPNTGNLLVVSLH